MPSFPLYPWLRYRCALLLCPRKSPFLQDPPFSFQTLHASHAFSPIILPTSPPLSGAHHFPHLSFPPCWVKGQIPTPIFSLFGRYIIQTVGNAGRAERKAGLCWKGLTAVINLLLTLKSITELGQAAGTPHMFPIFCLFSVLEC